MDWLTSICNRIVKEETIPESWQMSELVPIYKGKGDVLKYSSTQGIKLLEHGMKVAERVLERRLRQAVEIDKRQFGFRPGIGTTEPYVRLVSEWFGVNVGVHQGSVLSPLLFITVMEAVTHSVREGLPWAMLYADDLVLVGKCEEELKEKLRKWNECLKDKGLKIYEDKTKVMCVSFGTGTTQVLGNVKHPCSICLKGVGALGAHSVYNGFMQGTAE